MTGGGSAGCNSANCGSGCCQGTVCVMPPSNSSNTTCGFAGLACSNCTALGGICNQTTLICEPGTGGGSAGGGTAVGDSCTSPAVLVLSGGSGSTSGSLTGLANDSTQCSGAGPDAVYSVTVTSTGTLQASVTAVGFTPRISIRSTCTGTPLACDANPISGIAQTSTTVSPGTYFIWIDSSVSGAGGSYSLLVSTSGGAGGGSAGGGSAGGGSPAGGSAGGGSAGSYTKSVITASCDTITSGTIESAAIADDAATTQATLPISFSFFGLPMTSYTVSSNGLMQVWTGSGLGDEDSSNPASFITNPTPGGIAPFWDDLDVNPSTSLRSQVLGTGTTRRFVVEWIDWGFYASGTSSTADRLRFQAKLFENGVIEFHYCSMVGTGAITGTSATIGIGDGVVNEVIHGSTVSSGTGLRFTP